LTGTDDLSIFATDVVDGDLKGSPSSGSYDGAKVFVLLLRETVFDLLSRFASLELERRLSTGDPVQPSGTGRKSRSYRVETPTVHFRLVERKKLEEPLTCSSLLDGCTTLSYLALVILRRTREIAGSPQRELGACFAKDANLASASLYRRVLLFNRELSGEHSLSSSVLVTLRLVGELEA